MRRWFLAGVVRFADWSFLGMGELLSKQLSPEELPPPAKLPLGQLTRLSLGRVLSSRAAYVSPSSVILLDFESDGSGNF